MKHYVLYAVVLFMVPGAFVTAQQTETYPQKAPVERYRGAVPQRALDVYNYVVLNGKAPKGYVGGRIWYNRERHLPRGHYHEFDVHPKTKGVNRGAERVLVDFDTNHGWYTADHYRTFVPIPSTHHQGPKDDTHGVHSH